MIIETTANQYFEVTETGDSNLSHVWYGQQVKRTKNGFIPVKKIRMELVRKLGTKLIQA